MKTKSLALSVAALTCLAATSASAGSAWSFAFGYSAGGFGGAVQVAAPIAPACAVVSSPVPWVPYARVAYVAPAPAVVVAPGITCVAPVVVRPVAVCAPLPVYYHGHYHHHHGW